MLRHSRLPTLIDWVPWAWERTHPTEIAMGLHLQVHRESAIYTLCFSPSRQSHIVATTYFTHAPPPRLHDIGQCRSVYQTPAAGERVTFHSPVDTPDSRAGASRGTEESPPLSTSHLRPASQPAGRPPLSPGRTRPQVGAIEARLADYAELTRQKLTRDLQAALQRAENAESRIEGIHTHSCPMYTCG